MVIGKLLGHALAEMTTKHRPTRSWPTHLSGYAAPSRAFSESGHGALRAEAAKIIELKRFLVSHSHCVRLSWLVHSMSFFKRWFSHSIEPEEATKAGGRRRSLENLLTPSDQDPVPGPKDSPARQEPVAPSHPSAPKKPKAPSPAVAESVSVILRRQVPIRFDDEAPSWLGGLPRMPVGTEWPRAKPKKPLHFVAQVDCAGLPQDLWGGLGPREGWLLLFVDIEAINEQKRRPIARVLHVSELGPETEPPAGLIFARRDVVDLDSLKKVPPRTQRRHFRKWPVDLVQQGADTSRLTGSDLYGAPENDCILTAHLSFAEHRPMTWRGVYTLLAGLVQKYGREASGGNSSVLFDYPEPDASGYNKEWQKRRDQLPEKLQGGYFTPEFTAADSRLKAQIYEERRKGWTQRAFKVLEEELAVDEGRLTDYRGQLAEAMASGDEAKALSSQGSIEYFEKKIAQHLENRTYLQELFAQFPSEEALVGEINEVGRAHQEWAQRTQERLRALLDRAGTMDLDTSVSPNDWDAIVADIASMKSVYWTATYGTDVLKKIESNIYYEPLLSNVIREEVLDRYASPPESSEGLDPEIVADIEPRLRNLECERPHKLGGLIDSVYGDPLEKGHVLLFQVASDAATGWIWGDLGTIYVSIHRSDLAAGSFDKADAWLEA
jgi:uncharacterized protein YwqG